MESIIWWSLCGLHVATNVMAGTVDPYLLTLWGVALPSVYPVFFGLVGLRARYRVRKLQQALLARNEAQSQLHAAKKLSFVS